MVLDDGSGPPLFFLPSTLQIVPVLYPLAVIDHHSRFANVVSRAGSVVIRSERSVRGTDAAAKTGRRWLSAVPRACRGSTDRAKR